MTDSEPTWIPPEMDMLRGFYEMARVQPPEWLGMAQEQHDKVFSDYATFREALFVSCVNVVREDIQAGRLPDSRVTAIVLHWLNEQNSKEKPGVKL